MTTAIITFFATGIALIVWSLCAISGRCSRDEEEGFGNGDR